MRRFRSTLGVFNNWKVIIEALVTKVKIRTKIIPTPAFANGVVHQIKLSRHWPLTGKTRAGTHVMMTNAIILAMRIERCHRTWLENIGDDNDLNVVSRPKTSMVYGAIHKTNYISRLDSGANQGAIPGQRNCAIGLQRYRVSCDFKTLIEM